MNLALLLAAAVFANGCGAKVNSVPSADLSGSATLDQKPIEMGTITFIPIDGNAPTAGAIIESGKYFATVPKGDCRIEISAPKVVGKSKMYNTQDSPEIDITKEAVPAKYNVKSELTHLVEEDKSDLNFDLQSRR